MGVADDAGCVRAQQMRGNGRVTRTDNHHVCLQFGRQFIYRIAYAAESDMRFDPLRVDAEVADHGLQAIFRFVLQMFLEATHIGGKAVQAQAGGAWQHV